MTGVADIRHARVSLAVLFEPDNRPLHDLLAAHGVIATQRGLADGSLPMPELRPELQGWPTGRLWDLGVRALQEPGCGIRIVTPEDDEWPPALPDLTAVPTPADNDLRPAGALCLWACGDRAVAGALARSVTLVGSRASTSYGGHLAAELGYGLAERDWTVVSGGGYGIGAAAHRAAMSCGTTVAVLAYGLDRRYPAGNTALLDRIADSGLLLSLWPPGTPPVKRRFTTNAAPLAALTEGTVAVEAARRSGALTVLHTAVALGRAAMAVPGPVTSAQSAGTNAALREDSRITLVSGVADVLATLDAHTAPA
jgi:DNA processing protein